MFPYFDLFGKTISMYALMAIVGMLVSGFVVCRMVKKLGRDDTDAVIAMIIGAVGVLIGSHFLYALTNLSSFSLYADVDSFSEFLSVTNAIFGGSVFYGGLLGGIGAGLIGLHIVKFNKREFFDILSFCGPLFHGIARIGCFFGGCCYGIESSFGFTAHGNTWVPAVNDVSRFPVQLLESLCCFLIAIAMYNLYRLKKMKGFLFPLYLISYSVVRFLDEYLRGDAIRGFIGPFSTSQMISILVAIVSIGIIVFWKIKKNNELNTTSQL